MKGDLIILMREGDHAKEPEKEREGADGASGGPFPPFGGSGGPPFGSPGFGPPGLEVDLTWDSEVGEALEEEEVASEDPQDIGMMDQWKEHLLEDLQDLEEMKGDLIILMREGDHAKEPEKEREGADGASGGPFPPFGGSGGPPFGSTGFGPPGFEQAPGFGGQRGGFGGPKDGPPFGGPPGFGSPGFDGPFRGRGGRGRGGWRGRGGPDGPFRGGPDMGFRGRGGPRGGRGGFGGPQGHWNDGPM